jgi:endonuclease I
MVIVSCSYAQIPAGYYNNAQNKSGAELKSALRDILYPHTTVSYDAIWLHFQTSDVNESGIIKDIYSNCIFYYGTHQSSGGASGECSGYNREHSFPKSWFGDLYPMYTDMHHIYPTDSYNNTRRSNNPYGTVAFPTYTTSNGGQLGKNIEGNYFGTVFEPDDDYKGDLARTYFYMITCYENNLNAWVTNNTATTAVEEVLDGSTFPAFNNWYLRMLYRWHQQDSVSQKEINRNDAIYTIQGNRNPFIDHPEWVDAIWHDYLCDPCANTTQSVTFSQPEAVYYDSITVALDNNDPQSVIYYTTDGSIPTENSFVYQQPVKIYTSTVIRTFARNLNYAQSLYSASTYYIITTSDVITANVSNAHPASQGNPVKIALYCNNMTFVPEVKVTNPVFEVNKTDLNLNLDNHYDTLLIRTTEQVMDSTFVVIVYGNRNDSLKVRSSDAVIGWKINSAVETSNYGDTVANIGIPISVGTGRTIGYQADYHCFTSQYGWNTTGNYWQTASFSTKNKVNLTVKFLFRSSGTGPKNWKLQYSMADGTWIQQHYGAVWIDVPNSAFTASETHLHYEIALPEDCYDQKSLLLRWQVVGNESVNGGNISGSAATRLGDIEVNGITGNKVANQSVLNENYIYVFPNPCSDYFVVSCDMGDNSYTSDMCDKRVVNIYDLNGKLHISQLLHVSHIPQKINVVDLKPGTYLLKIGDYTAKFVKSR